MLDPSSSSSIAFLTSRTRTTTITSTIRNSGSSFRLVVVLVLDCFPHQQDEDDDEHEHDHEDDFYLPTRITCPSGLDEPPAFSTLIANAAADSTGVTVSKLVRISPSLGTAKTPALTGWVIFGSITHN